MTSGFYYFIKYMNSASFIVDICIKKEIVKHKMMTITKFPDSFIALPF
jgi:hypothetical protein